MSQTTSAPPVLFSREWWEEIVHAVVTTSSLEGARLLNERLNPDGREGVQQAFDELVEVAQEAAGHPSLDDLGVCLVNTPENESADADSPIRAEHIGSLALEGPLAAYDMTLAAALKVQSRATSHIQRAREMHANAIETLFAVAQTISPVRIGDEIAAYTSPFNGHFSRPRRARVISVSVSSRCQAFPTDWKQMKELVENGQAFVATLALVRKDGDVAQGDAYRDEVPLDSLRKRMESGALVVEPAPPADADEE